MCKLEIYRGVMCHDMKNDAKFEEQFTCQFKIEFSNLMNFESSTQKSQKFEF